MKNSAWYEPEAQNVGSLQQKTVWQSQLINNAHISMHIRRPQHSHPFAQGHVEIWRETLWYSNHCCDRIYWCACLWCVLQCRYGIMQSLQAALAGNQNFFVSCPFPFGVSSLVSRAMLLFAIRVACWRSCASRLLLDSKYLSLALVIPGLTTSALEEASSTIPSCFQLPGVLFQVSPPLRMPLERYSLNQPTHSGLPAEDMLFKTAFHEVPALWTDMLQWKQRETTESVLTALPALSFHLPWNPTLVQIRAKSCDNLHRMEFACNAKNSFLAVKLHKHLALSPRIHRLDKDGDAWKLATHWGSFFFLKPQQLSCICWEFRRPFFHQFSCLVWVSRDLFWEFLVEIRVTQICDWTNERTLSSTQLFPLWNLQVSFAKMSRQR